MNKKYSIEKDNPYYREIVCLEIIGEHIDEPDKCFLCYQRKVWEEVDDGEIEHMGFEPICSLDEPIFQPSLLAVVKLKTLKKMMNMYG